MKFDMRDVIGNHAFLYARQILKRFNFRSPPISEKVIADDLKMEIKEISNEMVQKFRSLNPDGKGDAEFLKFINSEGAFLKKEAGKKPQIFVHQDMQPERKRFSIFHECGHKIIPWHDELNYLCSEKDIDPTAHKRIEREAFSCGSEFMMPIEMFVDDILSIEETSINSISKLRYRYRASMEATAIRYVNTHPGTCAMIMVEPKDTEEQTEPENLSLHDHCSHPHFDFAVEPKTMLPPEEKPFPLKVKYFVGSNRFPHFIRPGTGFDEESIIYETWTNKRYFEDEIPSSMFRLPTKCNYRAEGLKLGNTGKMMVLLWKPTNQIKIDYKTGLFL